MSLGYVGNPPSTQIISKDIMWEEMKKYRTQLLEGGCPVGGHWYYTDLPSKMEFMSMKLHALERMINQEDLNVNIQIGNSPVYVKTMDNGYIQITYQNVKDIVAAIEARTKTIYAVMAQHKQLMYLCEDFLNYNYKTGFPEQFTGEIPPIPTN